MAGGDAQGRGRVVAAVGLRKEARLIASPRVVAIPGGGDGAGLARRLREAAAGASGLISIGLAGALDPALRVGDAVIGVEVRSDARCWPTDPGWTAALCAALPEAYRSVVAGVDRPAAGAVAKADLRASLGAVVVDMESQVAAVVAADLGLPFAVLRYVSDEADRTLPPAALVGMRADGSMDVAAVIGALVRRPSQFGALMRTAREAEVAFRALARGRQALGPTLGLADV